MDIQWKDSYKIGNTKIDAEHQHLFALAAKILDAPDRANQQAVAMAFYKYTREHFEHEETMMRESNYHGYQKHIGWHNRIISRLNDISEGIARQEPDRSALESLMNDWLVTHIADEDAQLAQYVGNR